jgi:hypothetical protein
MINCEHHFTPGNCPFCDRGGAADAARDAMWCKHGAVRGNCRSCEEEKLEAAGWRLWENQPPPPDEEVEYYRPGFSEGGRVTPRHVHPAWNIAGVWWR